MPTIQFPRSDADRVDTMTQMLEQDNKDEVKSEQLIMPKTIADMAAFLPNFQTKVEAVASKRSALSKEAEEGRTAAEILARYCRHFFAVLKLRVERHHEPASVLQYYGLPLDGSAPNPTAQRAWLKIGQKIVTGEAEAVAAGYPAMINPGAAEVKEKLDIASKELSEVKDADANLDNAQAEVEALREKADQLIRYAVGDLRYHLERELDAPSVRRVMRRYGVKFRYLKGEPIDPDDTTAVTG